MEEKRVALRRALKREYMRQGYDPAGSNATGKRVFDSAFYRWSAIHNSQEILVRNTVRNFGVYAVTFIIPVIVFAKILNRDQVSVQKLLYMYTVYTTILCTRLVMAKPHLMSFFGQPDLQSPKARA